MTIKFSYFCFIVVFTLSSLVVESSVDHEEFWRDNYYKYSPILKESVSGSGSTLQQMRYIRQSLPELFSKYQIGSVLDAPCGDFYWMKEVRLHDVCYHGIDIVEELISKNKAIYSNPNTEFSKRNIIQDELPTADLILCRDCLVHFSFRDIFRALQNFKKSGAKYLLTTTFTSCIVNEEIATGGWRPLNLELPPFNFPPPTTILQEGCTEHDGRYADKSLGLWELDEMLARCALVDLPAFTHMTQPMPEAPELENYHEGVVGSIKRGFSRFSISYNYNPKNIDDIHPVVWVTNNRFALGEAVRWKREGKIKLLIAGPNFDPHSHPEFLSQEIDYVIAASEWWKKELENRFPLLKDKVVIWPAGVDVSYWKPKANEEKRKSSKNVLVYRKTESLNSILSIEEMLRKKGWHPIRLQSKHYDHRQYRDLLSICRFAVFVSVSETQGLALAEAWAMNVPTLVWDPKNATIYGKVCATSSAPYLCDRLGKQWINEQELEEVLDSLPQFLEQCHPRYWVLRHMSDEASACFFAQILTDAYHNKVCDNPKSNPDRFIP